MYEYKQREFRVQKRFSLLLATLATVLPPGQQGTGRTDGHLFQIGKNFWARIRPTIASAGPQAEAD